MAHLRRRFVQPLWLGEEPLAGRTILLHSEQGLGDTLQFVRYAPLVARRGAKVLLEVQPPLLHLLSDIDGVVGTFAQGEKLPAFDLHCPLMSLPLAFGTESDSIPAAIPYLRADADLVSRWRRRMGERRVPRIGIAWAGSAVHKNNSRRSIALERFAPLLKTQGVEFVSIQKELSQSDAAVLEGHAGVLNVGGELGDFTDTAAVVSSLDLVISADTSVAHLGGRDRPAGMDSDSARARFSLAPQARGQPVVSDGPSVSPTAVGGLGQRARTRAPGARLLFAEAG